MNNVWTRREEMEDSFNDLHGVKPVIYRQHITNSCYKIKLVLGGKEIILQEDMEKGLTKYVTMQYDDAIIPFKSMYDAEQSAAIILRS